MMTEVVWAILNFFLFFLSLNLFINGIKIKREIANKAQQI